MSIARDDFSVQSLLGHDSFVQGNLKTQGLTRIDGSVDGDVETDGTVILGDECRIRGNIKASSVTLLGSIVLGNIDATGKVRLTKGAVVLGDVTAKNIYMDEGCILNGHCVGLSNESEKNAATALYEREDAIREAVKATVSAPAASVSPSSQDTPGSAFGGSPALPSSRYYSGDSESGLFSSSRADTPDSGGPHAAGPDT